MIAGNSDDDYDDDNHDDDGGGDGDDDINNDDDLDQVVVHSRKCMIKNGAIKIFILKIVGHVTRLYANTASLYVQ